MIIIESIKELKDNKKLFDNLKISNYQQTYENIYSIHLSNDTAKTFIYNNFIGTFIYKNESTLECALNIEPLLLNNNRGSEIFNFIKMIHETTNKTLYFPLVYEDSIFYKKLNNKLYNYERLYTSIANFKKYKNNIIDYVQNSNSSFFTKRSIDKFEKNFYIEYYTKKDVSDIITNIEINSWKHDNKQDMVNKHDQLVYYSSLIKKGISSIAVAYKKDTKEPAAFRIDAIYNDKIHVLKNSYNEKYKKYSLGSYMLIEDLYKRFKKYEYVDLYGGPGLSKQLIETNRIKRFDMFYGNIDDIKKIESNRKKWDDKNYENYIKGNSIKNVFNKKENILVATSCFGLGPVGKLHAILDNLKDEYNLYASGEKFDLKIFDEIKFKDYCFTLEKNEIEEFVKKYNIKYAIVVLKNKMARLLKEIGIKVLYVDSLPFMWSEKDANEGKVPYNVDVYCAQKTIELSSKSKKIFSKVKNLVWVNPIINLNKRNIECNIDDFILINLGGLHSPNTDGLDYFNIVVKPLIEIFKDKKIIITTSTESKRLLDNLVNEKNVTICTLTQNEFASYIRKCEVFITSPGLTTILESSNIKESVIFLPPQNISQFYNIEYGKKIFNSYKSITWNDSKLTLDGLKDELKNNEHEVIVEINKRIKQYNDKNKYKEYKKYINKVLNSKYKINKKERIKYDGVEQIISELKKLINSDNDKNIYDDLVNKKVYLLNISSSPNIGNFNYTNNSKFNTMVKGSNTYRIDIYNESNIEGRIRNLGGGDPIKFKTYKYVKRNINRYLSKNLLNKYPHSFGDEEIKNDLCNYLKSININNIDNNNILITSSTTQAYNLILNTIINENDIILVPTPTYGLFTYIPDYYGCNVEFIDLDEDKGWILNIEELENKIVNLNQELKNKYSNKDHIPRVTALYHQNPNNPLGVSLGKNYIEYLKNLLRICKKYNICIIDDLVYRDSVYDNNNRAIPLASFDEYKDNVISLFGISKSYSLAALRAGFTVGNKYIIQDMKDNLFLTQDSVSILSQIALSSIFNTNKKNIRYKEKFLEKINKKYLYNLDIVKYFLLGRNSISLKSRLKIERKLSKEEIEKYKNGTSNIKFYNNMIPQSGFFVLIDFTKIKGKELFNTIINNDIDLIKVLYKNYKIKFLPGSSFGWNNESQIIGRITFSKESNILLEDIKCLVSIFMNI